MVFVHLVIILKAITLTQKSNQYIITMFEKKKAPQFLRASKILGHIKGLQSIQKLNEFRYI
ncbi:MAG: hypothetical protein A2X54_07015 [Nitrospirae bacterium GWF2_44_13]|nr:MAG: hypothetical protein A2X54_07015 [Nitrospirae bacterium GWF2_44_13]OGW34249.1 MAG: hypothetical protein A2088_00690 [Nitrospirae bacterium GWD2_44_7]OGW63629.1 MAG: hypothetical protein A2222_07050 [Nitrospirae bacterium RIFOXYA2_FULL_44_9]OGW73572.1 MAG: hypothetical protein A2484_08110 [Nitrospirae bacterium RIFOXYC2_FULL_44_7]HBG91864.1 hypothetical protein [Nitrospiraceae bacterium]